MLKPEDFVTAGYRKFTGYTGHETSAYGFQKLIADEVGRCYYITVSVYDNSRHTGLRAEYINNKPYSFVPHVQFELCDTTSVDIELLIREETNIAKIESHFHRIWTQMSCKYYSRFEE